VKEALGQMNCVPQRGVENWRLWCSTENLITEILRNLGAENSHHRKQKARKTCAELPERCDKDGAAFLSGTIRGDGTWDRLCDPLKKRNEWKASPVVGRQVNLKVQISAGKVMASFLWGKERIME
jgi:hypothetical protein